MPPATVALSQSSTDGLALIDRFLRGAELPERTFESRSEQIADLRAGMIPPKRVH